MILILSITTPSYANNKLSLSQVGDVCIQKFNAYLLSPKSNSYDVNSIALLTSEELPKIGICINLFQLSPILTNPRTFQNQIATPQDGMPDFKHGGFDLFIVNVSSSLAYDPSLFYSSNSFAPKGSNIAYFQNNTMDNLIKSYNQTIDPVERLSIGDKIQQMAYQELPYIPIASTGNLWFYTKNLNLANSSLFMIALMNFNSYWSKLINAPGITNTTYYTPFNINKFLPNLKNSFAGSLLLSSLWSKLYERNPNNPNLSYQPVMASNMPVYINSGKTIAQIKLRDNVTFSNGDPVTAQDIANTYHMAMTPAFGFTNYQKYMSYFDTANYGNNSVTAFNSTTVQFRLKDPYFDAISLFNEPVLDQTIVGSYSNPMTYNLNSEPMNFSIGTGPFKLDSINSTTHTINLIKNINWWGENVNDWFGGFSGELNSIIFKYNVSRSDVLFDLPFIINYILDPNYNLIPKDVSNIPVLTYQRDPIQQMIIIAVNMHNPYFGTGLETPLGKSDPTRAAEAARYIRQAIAYMTPQQDIIEALYHGSGYTVTTLWPSYSPGYNALLPVRKYSLQNAKKLMVMAGYSYYGFSNNYSTSSKGILSFNFYEILFLSQLIMIIIERKKLKRN